MADRFFYESPLTIGDAVLDGAEAHHLIHVLRAKPGLEVVLFDGSGGEFLARVEKIERSAVRLNAYERRAVDRELPIRISLGVALPKGDRQRWLVEKCTELGVAELIPLETARGVAKPSATAIERLRRAVIEASKQCGRNRLMKIGEPRGWDDFTAAISMEPPIRWAAHPGGISLHEALTSASSGDAPQRNFVLAVRPEGGFTDPEIESAKTAGWTTIGLGERLLRVETAAIALVAAVGLR